MTVSEKQLDHWWDTLGKHSLLDYLNRNNTDVSPVNVLNKRIPKNGKEG